MSDSRQNDIGKIVWRDLTVPDAGKIKDFYCEVVGWTSTDHDMGDYADFNIIATGNGETVAGICHARGENAKLPPQWLIYITVEDVEASLKKCVALGGKIVDGPRMMGKMKFCVIQDPAGAVAALISQ